MQLNVPYVDLTSAQTIGGPKTFTAAMTVQSVFAQGAASAETLTPVTHNASATVSISANKVIDATSGPLTMTLPVAASSSFCRIMFTKFDASVNAVTIVPQAGGTIGGAASVVLTAQYQSVTLLNINSSVAGAWVVVGKT